MRLAASRYNLPIRSDREIHLLYNTRSGGLIRVPGVLGPALEILLESGGFDVENLPPEYREIVRALGEAGFFVSEGYDELEAVRRRRNSPETTLALTILPTMACNLRCTYCFQTRQGAIMTEEVAGAITQEVTRRLDAGGVEHLQVDWFGGEPLLARRVIRGLSSRLMEIAEGHGIPYGSALTTNGTLLTEDAVDMLVQAGLTDVQVTLDGPPEVHDRRRPGVGGRPSFDAVMRGIRTASRRLQVTVRINVDRDTVQDALTVVDMLAEEECFEAGRNVLPYIASTGPLTSVCTHTSKAMMMAADYFENVLAFQRGVIARHPNVDLTRVLELPAPLDLGCGAQSEASLCIDPAGMVFKCGLEAHDRTLAAGRLTDRFRDHPNYRKWIDADPADYEECADCLYLPLCLGGCPKHGADSESPFYGESCVYWRTCLVPILQTYAEARLLNDKQAARVEPG